ncbi:MAG TPA: hypothetical protein VIL48_03960 [Acidimicrobiales bacterium]
MADTAVRVRTSGTGGRLGLRVGELVEVRSAEEILATLDERGELDALPFMPEMLQHCGRRFTVHKVATKLCDTVTGTGMRRMRDAVHLAGVRCDGEAHGGCQTACLLYWKEAWLRRVGPGRDGGADGAAAPPPGAGPAQLTEADLRLRTRQPSANGTELFSCQATELLRAAPERLPLRDVGQYVRDVRTGNAGVAAVVRAVLVGLFNRLQSLSTRFLPRRLWFRGGLRWRFVSGALTRTPTGRTDLQPGELVRIKPQAEIMATLDTRLRNRGLGFEEEMARHCGREARVLRRVERCIDERTGRLLEMQNPCIVLEGVVCEGAYNARCPRGIYSFWREIWLERVEQPGGPA